MEPAYFTGTVNPWDAGSTEVTQLPDRRIEQWLAGFDNTMTDPRVTGRGEAMDYLETIDGPDETVVLSHSGHGRVTNEDGSWALECYGVASSDTAGETRIFCWYDGESGYEGLTAFTILTRNAVGNFDTEGWIFPGERPPLLPLEP